MSAEPRLVPITIHIRTTARAYDTDEMLLFSYNEGTHCINNDLIELVEQLDSAPHQCQCGHSWITLGHDYPQGEPDV